MKKPHAILFGAIGSLVESSALQHQSFQKAFAEAGLDWTWEIDEYKEMLRDPGGLERIRQYAEAQGDDVDAEALYERKNELFHEGLRERPAMLRDGVLQVLDFAIEFDVPLGFVTTTKRSTIDTLLETVPQLDPTMFAFIGDESMVENGKPAPDIYELAVTSLDLDASKDDIIVIEDSPSSRESAVAAGLSCLYFPGAFIIDRPEGIEAFESLSGIFAAADYTG